MRQTAALLLLLAAPSGAQDEARIRDLVRQLEDDSVETRERAQKELVAAGPAALPALRKALADAGDAADRGELRVRAGAAIRRIELDLKAREVYQEPKPVTLQGRDLKLSQALESIARQAGIRIDASAVDGEALVSAELREVPLFRALDELCRGAEERTYEYREEGVVKFLRERHVPRPAAYAGPFRIRILSMKLERSTDVNAKKATLALTLDADHEKYLKPWKSPDIEIAKATDDRGGALEVQEGEGEGDLNAVFGGGAFARIMVAGGAAVLGGVGPGEAQRIFTLKSLTPGAGRVSLRGSVRFRFPLDSRELRFEGLESGVTRETSDYTIRLETQGNRRNWNAVFRPRKAGAAPAVSLAQEIEGRLDAESLVGIDQDGGEHRGTFTNAMDGRMAAIRVVNGKLVQDADAATFIAQFPTVRLKPLKEIRFKFADATFVKSVPFSFEDVELP